MEEMSLVARYDGEGGIDKADTYLDDVFEGCIDLLKTHHFGNLTSLALIDVEHSARSLDPLLGPRGSLRSTIQSLTLIGGLLTARTRQWIFQYLRWLPNAYAWFTGGEYGEEEGLRDATVAELAAAADDLDTFLTLAIHPGADDTAFHIINRPPTPFPFAALKHLRLDLEPLKGDELHLIFLTNLFPTLVHLELVGVLERWIMAPWELLFLRRSVHKELPLPRGEILPPNLVDEPSPPTVLQQLAAPLTAAEVAAPSFATYRGPSLDKLDLSGVTIYAGNRPRQQQ